MSGNKKAITNIASNCIEFENVNEPLQITIDSKLKFEHHISKPW